MTDIKLPDGSVLALPSNMRATVTVGPSGETLVRIARKRSAGSALVVLPVLGIALAFGFYYASPMMRAVAGHEELAMEMAPAQAQGNQVIVPAPGTPQQGRGDPFGLTR